VTVAQDAGDKSSTRGCDKRQRKIRKMGSKWRARRESNIRAPHKGGGVEM